MSNLTVEASGSVPLTLNVSRQNTGGLTGLSPTVALRDVLVPGAYLDWSDSTFKTAGWVTKYAPMAEVERGNYQQILNLTAVGASAGNVYSAEFNVVSGASTGSANDTVYVVQVQEDVGLLRKMMDNRLEETPGDPGILVLYDDDGVTPFKTWQLRDAAGGPTTAAIGAPSRRSAGTP